jgi:hypothetical protein
LMLFNDTKLKQPYTSSTLAQAGKKFIFFVYL